MYCDQTLFELSCSSFLLSHRLLRPLFLSSPLPPHPVLQSLCSHRAQSHERKAGKLIKHDTR